MKYVIPDRKMLLLLMASTVSGYVAASDTATINISGNVSASTCELSMPATIDMGDLLQERLSVADGGATMPHYGIQMVDLQLSNCPGGQQYAVTLLGTPDTQYPSGLANMDTGTDAARSVAVEVWDGVSRLLVPNVTRSRTYVADTDGNSLMQLGFVPVKTGTDVVNGNISTTGQIKIDYL